MISVIVPVFNIKDYLSECIESLIDQSFDDYEIILIDDGSTDGSAAICDDYACKWNKIKVFHKINGGLSSARNAGIEIAVGEYLVFVDGDDLVKKTYLLDLYNSISKFKTDIAICGFSYFAKSKITSHCIFPCRRVLTALECIDFYFNINRSFFVVAWNKIYKREIFETLRYPVGLLHEDTYILHQIFSEGRTVSIINDCLYLYRKRENSIMSVRNQKSIVDTIIAYLNRASFFKNNDSFFEKTLCDLSNAFRELESVAGISENDEIDDLKRTYKQFLRKKILRKKIFFKWYVQILNPYWRKLIKFVWRLVRKILSVLIKINSVHLFVAYLQKRTICSFFIEKKLNSLQKIDIVSHEKKYIVSLTSIPSRLTNLKYTLYSLTQQNIQAQRILLYLGDDCINLDLPSDLMRFIKKGISIHFTKNIFSYKKIIPALIQYGNYPIITADDDIFYPPNWIENLHFQYQNDLAHHINNVVYGCRLHRIKLSSDGEVAPYATWEMCIKDKKASPFNFATGAGGILYPPGSLYPDVIQEELFLQLSPKADDVWLWAMTILNNYIPMYVKGNDVLKYVNYLDEISENGNCLHNYNITQKGNDYQIKNIFSQYPRLKNYLVY